MSITNTPNVGLQVPSYNTGNWQVPLNFDLSLLDLLLSGNRAVPNFLLAGALSLAASTASTPDTGIARTAPGVIAIGNGTPGDASTQVRAGSFHGDGSHLTGINGMAAQSQGVSLGNISTINFSTNLNAWVTGSTVTVAASFPSPVWTKYTVAPSGLAGNWMVNGVSAGAQSASSATQQIPLLTSAARQVFHAIVIKHGISFSAGGGTGIAVSVGTAAAPDALMVATGDAFDIMQAPSDVRFYTTGGSRILSFAATGIVLQIVVTGSTPSALTAGTLEVDLLTSVLP